MCSNVQACRSLSLWVNAMFSHNGKAFININQFEKYICCKLSKHGVFHQITQPIILWWSVFHKWSTLSRSQNTLKCIPGWETPSVPHQNPELSPKAICLGSEQRIPVNIAALFPPPDLPSVKYPSYISGGACCGYLWRSSPSFCCLSFLLSLMR